MFSRDSSVNKEGFRLLTARETQLILLASGGMTDKQIAHELQISPGTVITLWSKVRARLGISSRISAVSTLVSAIVRLTDRFYRCDLVHSESLLPGEIHLVLSSHQVVLAATAETRRAIALQAGDSLVRRNRSEVEFLDLNGQPILPTELPWQRALQSGQDVEPTRLIARTGGEAKEYDVTVHLHHDTILNQVAFLQFKTATAVVGELRELVARVGR